jgi:hypothetical protein
MGWFGFNDNTKAPHFAQKVYDWHYFKTPNYSTTKHKK